MLRSESHNVCNLIHRCPIRCLAFKYFNLSILNACDQVCYVTFGFYLTVLDFTIFTFDLFLTRYFQIITVFIISIEIQNRNNWFDLKWINISFFVFSRCCCCCLSLSLSFSVCVCALSCIESLDFCSIELRYSFKLDIIKMFEEKRPKWQNNYHKLMIEQNIHEK